MASGMFTPMALPQVITMMVAWWKGGGSRTCSQWLRTGAMFQHACAGYDMLVLVVVGVALVLVVGGHDDANN
jgi:hypothetical protein